MMKLIYHIEQLVQLVPVMLQVSHCEEQGLHTYEFEGLGKEELEHEETQELILKSSRVLVVMLDE